MKKTLYASALALTLGLASCDSYLDINDNPNSPSEDVVSTSVIFPGAEMALTSSYGDYLRIVGGYLCETYAHLNGTSNYLDYSQFTVSATRSSGTYTQLNVRGLANLETVRTKSKADEEWGTYLAATTLRAFIYAALVDCYGEMPYTEALDATNVAPKYDDGRVIYDGIIAELDEALSKASASDKVCTNQLYRDEDATNWVKFAKGLKLKLLMRIANVDNSVLDKVKALIEEGDLPTADVEYAGIWSEESGLMNPFYSEEFSSSWGSTQTNICGNLAILRTMQPYDAEGAVTYTDPRLSKFFKASSGTTYTGSVSGTQYTGTSLSSWCRPVVTFDSPVSLLSLAEIEFFESEYYARTGNETEATSHYNAAIEASFASAGADGAADYIARYPFEMANYKKSIGIQKWIALAGVNPFEGWCEARRLDYPAFDTSVTGNTFFVEGSESSFTNNGYTWGTFYTPIKVNSFVGSNKLLERLPYPESSTARNNNAPTFSNSDYTKPVFWGN